MKKYLIIFILLFPALAQSGEDANEIVRRADVIRAPKESFEFKAFVTHYVGDTKREGDFKVYVKDLDHALVELIAPISDRGKSMLMLNDEIWVYLPKIKKPVRVSLKQRLLGEVSIGDMTRANFSHDYDATLVGEETIENKPTYVLALTAKSPTKAYQKIRYWVAKNDYRPVQAEFFTESGQSLKKAHWLEFEVIKGGLRPTLLFYQNTIDTSKKSYLKFSGMEIKKFQDMVFTKHYMQTLE